MAIQELVLNGTGRECVTYGLATEHDINTAARIFVVSFPERVNRWFRKDRHAALFYRDLMTLLLRAHGKTFFAARSNNSLVGYLILTFPNTNLLRSLLRKGFIFRVASCWITGRYGLSLSLLRAAMGTLCATTSSKKNDSIAETPHVYVVAIDNNYRGMGIGSCLLQQAKSACEKQFSQLSLQVETDNLGAIRLYERTGFRIVKSDAFQHVMVWNF